MININKKIPNVSNAFKTGASLEYALDHQDEFDGLEEYLDDYVKDEINAIINMYLESNSWLDYYNVPCTEDIESDSIELESIQGYYLPYKVGKTKMINDTEYTFCTTLPMDYEIELYSINNNHVVYYIGENYLAVWIKSTEYTLNKD